MPTSIVRRALAAGAFVFAAHSSAVRAQQINTGVPTGDNFPVWFGRVYPRFLHPVGYLLVGQSFVAPQGVTRLDQIGFYLEDVVNFNRLTYHLSVAAFDAASGRIVGPLLFTSGVQAGSAATAPVLTTFGTGGVAVTPGQLYLATLVPELQPFPPGGDENDYGSVLNFTDSRYADGQLYIADALEPGLPDPLGLQFVPSGDPGVRDAAFVATFSSGVVPEPATSALAAVGLIGAGAAARRRVRRA